MNKERLIELIKNLDICEVISFELKYKNFNIQGQDERTIHFES